MFGKNPESKGRDVDQLPGTVDGKVPATGDRERQHSNVEEANDGSQAAEDFLVKNEPLDPESVLDDQDPIKK